MTLLICAVAGYLLGSVPFGIVMARLFGLGDLRKVGSGNIGATNVLRTGNKLAAFLTVVLDAGKGAIAVLIARLLFGEMAGLLAGLGAFVGHLFPIYLRFKGGKGVATFLGTLLAIAFWPGLACCATWLVAAVLTRISSVAALAASATAPLWLWTMGVDQAVFVAAPMGGLVWLRHKENISRLLLGEEPRISFGSKS
ncbi:MAG: glycerol-3-phosphate 1-O-acyltransferase PlsY [Pseudomonadota bacterium]